MGTKEQVYIDLSLDGNVDDDDDATSTISTSGWLQTSR